MWFRGQGHRLPGFQSQPSSHCDLETLPVYPVSCQMKVGLAWRWSHSSPLRWFQPKGSSVAVWTQRGCDGPLGPVSLAWVLLITRCSPAQGSLGPGGVQGTGCERVPTSWHLCSSVRWGRGSAWHKRPLGSSGWVGVEPIF